MQRYMVSVCHSSVVLASAAGLLKLISRETLSLQQVLMIFANASYFATWAASRCLL